MVDLISSSTTVLDRATRIDRLKKLLLSVGGQSVALQHPEYDHISVTWVLEGGFVMAGRIVPRVMVAHQCHLNVMTLWQRGYSGLIGIGTGWGLCSKDKSWARHSWGILRNGILETTPWGAGIYPDEAKCEKRFGVVLQGKDADSVADYVMRSATGGKNRSLVTVQ
jgi:hypothetical protein